MKYDAVFVGNNVYGCVGVYAKGVPYLFWDDDLTFRVGSGYSSYFHTSNILLHFMCLSSSQLTVLLIL